MDMNGRSWAAVILATAVAVSVVAISVGAMLALVDRHNELTDAQVALISTVLGAIVGALSTYLGVGHRGNGGAGDGPPASAPSGDVWAGPDQPGLPPAPDGDDTGDG